MTEPSKGFLDGMERVGKRIGEEAIIDVANAAVAELQAENERLRWMLDESVRQQYPMSYQEEERQMEISDLEFRWTRREE